ncbi:MAG TPA: hypothetical protein DEO68_01560 [Halomonas campaniensis]|uniref:Uncharacterized protein n=1 Tax=Halomonas campaniensis TaxID=213554 RepID=A0A3D0KBF6_9GAMM|nr:hypothetical protein [Halomonas campaniensis]
MSNRANKAAKSDWALLGHRLNPWRHRVITAGFGLTISNFADLNGGINITALIGGGVSSGEMIVVRPTICFLSA